MCCNNTEFKGACFLAFKPNSDLNKIVKANNGKLPKEAQNIEFWEKHKDDLIKLQ